MWEHCDLVKRLAALLPLGPSVNHLPYSCLFLMCARWMMVLCLLGPLGGSRRPLAPNSWIVPDTAAFSQTQNEK